MHIANFANVFNLRKTTEMFGVSWLVLRTIPEIPEFHWKYSWFSRQNWLLYWHKDFFYIWNKSKILRGIVEGPSLGGFDPARNNFQWQWNAEAFWWVIAKVLGILEFSRAAGTTGDCENLTKVCMVSFCCVFLRLQEWEKHLLLTRNSILLCLSHCQWKPLI